MDQLRNIQNVIRSLCATISTNSSCTTSFANSGWSQRSHTKKLELIRKTREMNVIIVSLPSHCTDKLQPLDLPLFKSLNNYYSVEVKVWLRNHTGPSVSERIVAEIFVIAYYKAATVKNTISGFIKSGIYPFNPHIRTHKDLI